jgi:hypothetical protein
MSALIIMMVVVAACGGPEVARNLVPDTPSVTPSYWCSWACQNYLYGQGDAVIDSLTFKVEHIARFKADAITEETLFGADGWLTEFYPKIRKDLYVVLDDGWDIPISNDYSYRNLGDLDPVKFPSFSGTIPEKWTQLNDWTTDNGWKGIGLWFRTNESKQDSVRRAEMNDDAAYSRMYWKERLEWSRDAGVRYWKMDVGGDDDKIRMMTDMKDEIVPDLSYETVLSHPGVPFTLLPEGMNYSPEFIERGKVRLTIADVIRLYDLSAELGNATMLLRFATCALHLQDQPDADALLNAEEEVYIAAALGGTVGVFRHPLIGLRPDPDPDIYLTGPRELKQRLDEVVRAVRWHRIAPAFPANAVPVEVDDNYLTDTWTFAPGEFWTAALDWTHNRNTAGETMAESAPARVTRGLPLPEVKCDGELPFVLASRNPNGAVSVASIGRVFHDQGYVTPKADVTLNTGPLDAPVGIFGYFDSLTLVTDAPLGDVTIMAQDLAGDVATDITERVTLDGNRLIIPGAVIEEIGLSAAAPGDLSDPGLVLVVE